MASVIKVDEIQPATGNLAIVADTVNPALRITQTGTGHALLVEDSANPDSTPFVIDNAGNVGIGTTTPSVSFHVNGSSFASSSSYVGDLGFYQTIGGGNPLLVWDANDYVSYDRTNNYMNFVIGSSLIATFTGDGSFYMNSGYGSTGKAYGCRAWVNFNGQGTVAIRGSGNVTSITDRGTGAYTVNLTTAMPDANYTISGIADQAGGIDTTPGNHNVALCGGGSISTTAAPIYTIGPLGSTTTPTLYDCLTVSVNIVR